MTVPFKADKSRAITQIAQAIELMNGGGVGERWLAVGCLAEAETSLAGLSLDVVKQVRDARHVLEKGGEANLWVVMEAVNGLGE